MARLVFEKTGSAVWISHLDLMRLFQRAFKRAGLELTHTQGFNPRPSVSIALPMSVGVESVCELLDFELDGDLPVMDSIVTALNDALVEGVRVLSASHGGRKVRDLALLSCKVTLCYDAGVPEGAAEAITRLFHQSSVVVPKKGKNGLVNQDIRPLIRSMDIGVQDAKHICIDAVICCQNPSLNPMQFVSAIERYLPELRPSCTVCRRLEIFDAEGKIFR